jgi:hypothetical protein
VKPEIKTPSQQIYRHIKALAEDIGPRGSTRQGEKEAAAYCERHFQKMGYTTTTDLFKSAISIYHPHILASLLMLSGFVIYPLGERLSAAIAAGLCAIALISDLLELAFISNPFRLVVPKGNSQNVFTKLPPQAEHRQDLIILSHLDTHQSGKIFSSPRWVGFFQIFTTLAFVTFSAQMGFFLAGILAQWDWLWYASIPGALSALILLAICWEADHAPFSPGANDNASAVGMLLTLAENLKSTPPQHTQIWFVCTGCEEVQHYGAIDFFKKHKKAFKNPRVLVFEMLGAAGPAWETKEGIVIPFKPDPSLVKIAEDIAHAHPEWGAYPSFIVGGNSEMADAVRAGLPAITFFGLTPEGRAPYWHQMTDTLDKMDPDILQRTYTFTQAFIRTLDSQAKTWQEAENPTSTSK